jgi:pectate lyase-like protein
MHFPSRFIFRIATLLLAADFGRAELIPADRLIDWRPGVSVGVPGGIPTDRTHLIDVTQAPYNADKTGATDAVGAIQAAINAAATGDVVYLPAGSYRCNGPLSTGYKSGITIRGAGAGTVISNYTSGSIFLYVGGGSDYNWSWPGTGNVITAGLNKGSTQITLADTSAFSVGQLVQLAMDNDTAATVVSVFGYQGLRRQICRVTGKSPTSLTIFPALYGDYSATRAVVHVAQFQANSVGVEDLVIDATHATSVFTICFEQCYGCWAKNVQVRFSANYHIFVTDSLNCEIRHNYLDQLNHSGTNGAGLLVNTASGCLFEDNIIYRSFPLIEVNHGSSGNVFAYNFCEDSGPGVAIDSNHAPHNDYNLYEGNIAPNLQADGYFGSASHDTIFRNWFHGLLNNQVAWCISLNRFTRSYSMVGNIFEKAGYTWPADGVSLGNPNIGNGSSTGIGPPWTDSFLVGAGSLSQTGSNVTTTPPIFSSANVGWFIMTPTNQVVALITAYTDPNHVTVNSVSQLSAVSYILTPGPNGYQELDAGVAATLIRKGNYYYYGTAIPATEALGADLLPSSLFRTAKPAWFGSLTWPPFDPTHPAPSPLSIPAGYRYINGSDPTDGGTPAPQQKPIGVRARP